MKRLVTIYAVISIFALAGIAQASSVGYTVSGWGPTQFPGPVTPPAGSPWGPNGYPGDTVELVAYTGTLNLTPGIYVQKINTLLWKIDYTYAGTETQWDYPAHWTEPLLFNIAAARGMTIDTDAGSLSQAGLLESYWINDYLSFGIGFTTSFIVDGYRVDITPLGLSRQGGTNFSGGNPWVQPSRDVMAEFKVTVAPPKVVTEPATDVTRTSATLNGLIQDSGADTCEWRFDWWSADMFASCGMGGALTTGQSFQLPIDGLEPETLYYFRAYARNAGGEAAGDILTFTTMPKCEGTLQLLDPNGGQELVAGSTYEITWQSTETVQNVLLEYSADNGTTWTDVNTVPNTGSYQWEVPDVNNSQQCLVRVSGAACPDVTDTSDNVFTIYRCCLLYDLNHDCIVNELDRDLLLSEWLLCGDPFDLNCP